MRLRQQQDDVRVARGLAQSPAQVDDRLVGAVVLDQHRAAQPQRRDVGAVLGQHLLHERPRAHRVAVREQDPGEHALRAPQFRRERATGLALAPLALLDRRLQQRRRGVRLAAVEAVGGEQRLEEEPVGRGLGIGLDQPLHLRDRRLPAARLLHEADHGDVTTGLAGLRTRELAQIGLGGVEVAVLQVPGDQGALHAGIVREPLGHRAQMRLDRRAVVEPHQDLQLEHSVVERAGAQGDRPLHVGERGLRVARLQRLGEHDLARDDLVGGLLENGAGLLDHAGAPLGVVARHHRLAVVEACADHPRAQGVGRGGDHGAAVALGLVPLALLDGDARHRLAHGDVVGILFGQAQVLPVAVGDLALLHEDLGQVAACLQMGAVVAEHVAELDRRPVEVALLSQLQPGGEEARRLLLGIVAGREQREERQGQKEARGHGNTRLQENGQGERSRASLAAARGDVMPLR